MVLTQRAQFERDICMDLKFPYHYGSYATWIRIFSYHRTSWSFHTTMVLTQQKESSEERTLLQFPYHYGSYATVLPRISRTLGCSVSIPLWFLRNERIRILHYDQTEYVSIPLWFSRNEKRIRRELVRQYVSIPLWFSRNQLRRPDRRRPKMFPYHYGSYATIVSFTYDPTLVGFHTTMVLTQHRVV